MSPIFLGDLRNMKTANIEFFSLDLDYVKYLHSIDSQVFYNPNDVNYDKKPYIGIIVIFDTYKYFIPLTSGKCNHLRLPNTGLAHMLIFENIKRKDLRRHDVYKVVELDKNGNSNEDKVKKILSLLNFKKAIPVPNNYYKRIDILHDNNRDLLSKEFAFCLAKKTTIISKAIKIIVEQHKTHETLDCQCDYLKLETACKQWAFDKLKIDIINKFNEFIYVNKDIDFKNIVVIKNGSFSRVDGFDINNLELQRIKIFAKDEFNQEKFIEVTVKVEAPFTEKILQK